MIDIHLIFGSLGSLEGNLVKKSVELLLFILITYMVTSEYLENPKKYYKYLLISFSALSFWKLVDVIVLANNVFGNLDYNFYLYIFNPIDHFLELSALMMLANAFLYPIIIKRKKFIFNIFFQMSSIIFLFIFMFVGMILEIVYVSELPEVFLFWSNISFTSIKIVFLLYALYTLSIHTEIRYKYRYSVIIAFFVYLITPFMRMINILFYSYDNARLAVAELPFPLLGVLLFTRVIYLKLVDKAYLKEKLKHEKILSAMKDKFVSVVSHELKTPLTSIKLYSSILESGKLGKVAKKQKDAINVIRSETKRLEALVSDILDLSRLENKRVKLDIKSFDLYNFLRQGMHNDLAKEKGIKIINKVPKDLKVYVDNDKFVQVMINLLSNAIKYSDNNKNITVKGKNKLNKTVIEVIDQGYGISKEELPKIFDKFYQVEHHMTRKQGGTGLGLAIVKEIIDLHKGKIEVKSVEGKGSTFVITLPNKKPDK